MRISDWSSDVCSSDLPAASPRMPAPVSSAPRARARAELAAHVGHTSALDVVVDDVVVNDERGVQPLEREIGRAACRERVCPYVSISVLAVSLKKKLKQTRHTP